MALKYLHVRMAGRERVHIVPVDELSLDDRFGEQKVSGGTMVYFKRADGVAARSLCGKWSDAWVSDPTATKRCEACERKR